MSAVFAAGGCGDDDAGFAKSGAAAQVSMGAFAGVTPAVAAGASDWGVVWTDENPAGEHVLFARVDASGVPGAPIDVDVGRTADVASKGSGTYGMAWRKNAPGDDNTDLFFTEVGAAGPGAITNVTNIANQVPPGHIEFFDLTWAGTAWAYAWCGNGPATGTPPAVGELGVYVLGVTGAAQQIHSGSCFARVDLQFDGTQLWVAYDINVADMGIFVERLTTSGAPVGPAVQVTPPGSYVGIEPELMAGRDDMAVLWINATNKLSLQRYGLDGADRGVVVLDMDDATAVSYTTGAWAGNAWIAGWLDGAATGGFLTRAYGADLAPRTVMLRVTDHGVPQDRIGAAPLGAQVGFVYQNAGQIFFTRATGW